MIVFYYLISCILIIIFLLMAIIVFSSITVDLKKLKIADAHTLSAIIAAAYNKKYEDIINNIEILIQLKINILNIIPINIITIDNIKIKKMLQKNKKSMKLMQQKQEKNKELFMNLIKNHIQINNINIDLSFGVHNAYYTALISAILMIVTSIGLSYITNNRIKQFKNKRKQKLYIENNFKYNVHPIYNDNIVIKLGLSFKITMKIKEVIKEILMYKYNLFVNNTNKYKVKES